MLKLSLQEKIVYQLIVEENMYAKDIAEKLYCTEANAKAHIHNILKKREAKCCRDLIYNYYKEKLNDIKIDYANRKTYGEERSFENENTSTCQKIVRFN